MFHTELPLVRARRTAAHVVRAVRAAVEQRQLTLSSLSRSTRIPRSTLERRLRDGHRLTVAELVRLAIALDIPSADLLDPRTQSRCVHSEPQVSPVDPDATERR